MRALQEDLYEKCTLHYDKKDWDDWWVLPVTLSFMIAAIDFSSCQEVLSSQEWNQN